MHSADFKKWPVGTLGLGLLACVVFVFSDWRESWSLHEDAWQSGRYWELWTGHWTHWNVSHLVWDVVVFVLLGSYVEGVNRLWLWANVFFSSLLIGLFVFGLADGVHVYRGLSGVDCALFVFSLGMMAWREYGRGCFCARKWVCLLILVVGLGLKLVWEYVMGTAFFASDLPAGVVNVPAAHVLGALAGLFCFAVSTRVMRIERVVIPS